jgi:hypothetical protein
VTCKPACEAALASPSNAYIHPVMWLSPALQGCHLGGRGTYLHGECMPCLSASCATDGIHRWPLGMPCLYSRRYTDGIHRWPLGREPRWRFKHTMGEDGRCQRASTPSHSQGWHKSSGSSCHRDGTGGKQARRVGWFGVGWWGTLCLQGGASLTLCESCQQVEGQQAGQGPLQAGLSWHAGWRNRCQLSLAGSLLQQQQC